MRRTRAPCFRGGDSRGQDGDGAEANEQKAVHFGGLHRVHAVLVPFRPGLPGPRPPALHDIAIRCRAVLELERDSLVRRMACAGHKGPPGAALRAALTRAVDRP